MIRCLAVVVSCFATTVAGLSLATANAAPPDAAGPKPSCVYTLSTPEVVQVSGSAMVRLTLKPYPCTGSINPNYLSVCLKPESSANNGTCGFSSIPTFAQVYLPYKPGITYVATGTGCGSVYTEEGSICASVGPVKTTL